VKNIDKKCLKYAILNNNIFIHKSKCSKHKFRMLEKTSGLKFSCLSFPTPVKLTKLFDV